MTEPGFLWVRDMETRKRILVFTCPLCLQITKRPETLPEVAKEVTFFSEVVGEKYDKPLFPRLAFCPTCDAWVRTPSDDLRS